SPATSAARNRSGSVCAVPRTRATTTCARNAGAAAIAANARLRLPSSRRARGPSFRGMRRPRCRKHRRQSPLLWIRRKWTQPSRTNPHDRCDMSIGDLTKQIAQQALLSSTSKEPALQPQPESLTGAILNEIARMQKALKEDEELAVYFQLGTERIRVSEV